MKPFILFLFSIVVFSDVQAQLKTTVKCPDFNIDILDGKVNKDIFPYSTMGQIQLHLPCFSGIEKEGDSSKCGGAVFYKDKDVTFYTNRHYIEIGPHYKGTLSIPLMGAPRNGLFKWLGDPEIKDVHWDAFQTSYGILILYYNNASRVDKIQISTEKANTIRLCQ